MKLTTLIVREIAHFRVTFVVAILAVTAAISVLVGELTLLAAHDIGTERIISEQEQRLLLLSQTLDLRPSVHPPTLPGFLIQMVRHKPGAF